MATRFYLPLSGTPPLSPAVDAGWEDTSTMARILATTAKAGAALMPKTFIDTNADDKDILLRQYITAPLAAQTIAAQTVKLQIQGAQTSATNNMKLALGIRAIDGLSASRGTILAITRKAAELEVLAATEVFTNQGLSATTSALAIQTGDRLALEIGAGGDPDPGLNHNCQLRFGDLITGTDLPENDTETGGTFVPWVEFANTLAFQFPGPPEATVNDLLNAALKEIGVVSIGETLPAEDATDALAALNRMIEQWAVERLYIYTVTRTLWTVTANDGTYSIGPGSDVNISRPVYVDHVNYLDTSTDPDTEYPLHKLTEDGWAGISQKGLTNTFPASWYYNPTYPNGTLDLWPIPTGTTLRGVLYAPQQVLKFDSLAALINLPPGYEELIVTNLALRLATPYGRQVDPSLRERAQDAKAIVKRVNRRLMYQSFDPAALIGGEGYSWDTRTGA